MHNHRLSIIEQCFKQFMWTNVVFKTFIVGKENSRGIWN